MSKHYSGYKPGTNSKGLTPTDPPERTPSYDGDDGFKKACELAGVPPTRRQYSKYLRKFGAAYKAKTTTSEE